MMNETTLEALLNLIDESPLLCKLGGQPARLFEKRSLHERSIRIQEQALMVLGLIADLTSFWSLRQQQCSWRMCTSTGIRLFKSLEQNFSSTSCLGLIPASSSSTSHNVFVKTAGASMIFTHTPNQTWSNYNFPESNLSYLRGLLSFLRLCLACLVFSICVLGSQGPKRSKNSKKPLLYVIALCLCAE